MERLSIAVEEWELYNNGILLCKWFDSDSDIEDINDYVRNAKIENGLNSEDLELFCADWEYDRFNIVSENSNIEKVFEIYQDLERFDEYELNKIEYLTSQCGYDLDDAIDKQEDVQIYDIDNFKDLVEEFIQEGLYGSAVSELWKNNWHYLDLDAMARDLEFDYNLYDGKIYRVD